MCDLICDVSIYCAWSFGMDKKRTNDKILIKNLKKEKSMDFIIVYVNCYFTDDLGVHVRGKKGKLMQQGSADVNNTHIAASRVVHDVTN